MASDGTENGKRDSKQVLACDRCDLYSDNLTREADWHKGCGGFFRWTVLNLKTGELEAIQEVWTVLNLKTGELEAIQEV